MSTITTPTEKLRAVWVNSGEVDRATWAERAYDALHLARRLEESHVRLLERLQIVMDTDAAQELSESIRRFVQDAITAAKELK